tara:strand:- start:3 stop:554 length:552 start_codon:yes stop_codon:yes gene_type:complete
MDLRKVNLVLRNFGHSVVQEAKSNAPKDRVSGKLKDSISFTQFANENQAMITFFMEEYGKYQDLGVKGTKSGQSLGKKYYGTQGREYKYTTKMPPPNKLDRFVVRKGLAPRDERGRFTGRSLKTVGFQKSITFLIARSIFGKGIKPTLFFSEPFRKYFRDFPRQIAEAYGDDFETFVSRNFNA